VTEPSEVEVGVIRWVAVEMPTPSDEPDEMGPASPRHARQRPTLWQRTVTAGHESLATASEAIAAEVDAVAERMIGTLEARHADRAADRASAGAPEPAWQLDEVEVTFGVQLTGEASIAVFSATTESSAEITLRFTRAAAPTS
jgi:hypothetical protein